MFSGQAAEEDLLITRSLSDKKPAYDHSKTGFLWSWNFMISRKWKQLNNTGRGRGERELFLRRNGFYSRGE